MNLEEFASLTQDQQLDFISDIGVRLSQRVDEDHVITLYGTDSFLVELFFDRKKLCFTHLSAFEGSALPKVYFETEDFAPNWKAHYKTYPDQNRLNSGLFFQ